MMVVHERLNLATLAAAETQPMQLVTNSMERVCFVCNWPVNIIIYWYS
jgi:hypothetical protein